MAGRAAAARCPRWARRTRRWRPRHRPSSRRSTGESWRSSWRQQPGQRGTAQVAPAAAAALLLLRRRRRRRWRKRRLGRAWASGSASRRRRCCCAGWRSRRGAPLRRWRKPSPRCSRTRRALFWLWYRFAALARAIPVSTLPLLARTRSLGGALFSAAPPSPAACQTTALARAPHPAGDRAQAAAEALGLARAAAGRPHRVAHVHPLTRLSHTGMCLGLPGQGATRCVRLVNAGDQAAWPAHAALAGSAPGWNAGREQRAANVLPAPWPISSRACHPCKAASALVSYR